MGRAQGEAAMSRRPDESAAIAHSAWGGVSRWGAGFVATAPAGQRFTALSATFLVPRAAAWRPRRRTGLADVWAGVGVTSRHGALVQAGAEVYSAGDAPLRAVSWWEAFPGPQRLGWGRRIPPATRAGDRLAVTVRRVAAERWTLSVVNNTRGTSVSATCIPCHSAARTAGWIVEDPESVAKTGPAPAFVAPAQVRFVAAAAALDGGPMVPLSQLRWQPVCRVSGHGVLAPSTGGPTTTGGFTVRAFPVGAPHPALCAGEVPAVAAR